MKTNIKVHASTLVEVVIALTIIISAFGLFMIVLLNLQSSTNNTLKVMANLTINELRARTKAQHRYIDEEIQQNGLTLIKTIAPHNSSKNLYEMRIVAHDINNKSILEIKELILINE